MHAPLCCSAVGARLTLFSRLRVLLTRRLLSCLLYLNGLESFEGGSTSFLELGLEVKPAKGAALVWFNCELPLDMEGGHAASKAGCEPAAVAEGSTADTYLRARADGGAALPAALPGFGDPPFMVPDVRSTHAGMPVHSGLKYAANKWVHAVSLRPPE